MYIRSLSTAASLKLTQLLFHECSIVATASIALTLPPEVTYYANMSILLLMEYTANF